MVRVLGKLESLNPRKVWPHEAHDFTPWLLDNADALADVLGIDMELSTAEHPVGGYSLDLLGKDLTNNCVLIVENQLTATDHGHLGQILTYAAGTEAKTIVWMATSFREEHRQALDYLNDLAGDLPGKVSQLEGQWHAYAEYVGHIEGDGTSAAEELGIDRFFEFRLADD